MAGVNETMGWRAALVVPGDGRITQPGQFKGLRLATPQLGNTQDVALRYWLQEQGFRPVSLDRPGFGLTEPPRDAGAWREDPFAAAAQDMRLVADELKFGTELGVHHAEALRRADQQLVLDLDVDGIERIDELRLHPDLTLSWTGVYEHKSK